MTPIMNLTLEQLIDDLQSTYVKISEHIGIQVETHLPEGVSDASIRKFEKERHFELPPSYRAFLKLHNGWVGFLGDYTLIGVSGAHTEEALGHVDALKADFTRCWAAAGRGTDVNQIKEYEAGGTRDSSTLSDAHIYLPTKPIFGVGFANHYLLFDDRTRARDGEMEVIHLAPHWEIGNRYPGFIDMLRAYVAIQREQLQEHIDAEREEAQQPRRRRST